MNHNLLLKQTLIILFLFCSIHGSSSLHAGSINNNKNNSQTVQCQRLMTLEKILAILKQQPCAAIIQTGIRQIVNRNTNAGNVNIHALQATINDHRTMINYLINNSINATFVAEAINSHHSKTGPIFTSWRDLVDLIFISLLLGYIIYLLLCRTGFGPCDKILSSLFKPVASRVQQQQQSQSPIKTIAVESIRRKQPRPRSPGAHISNDMMQYSSGYLSD